MARIKNRITNGVTRTPRVNACAPITHDFIPSKWKKITIMEIDKWIVILAHNRYSSAKNGDVMVKLGRFYFLSGRVGETRLMGYALLHPSYMTSSL